MSDGIGMCMQCLYWRMWCIEDGHIPPPSEVMGNCRKRSPMCGRNGTTRWPETSAVDWCGDWELDPEMERPKSVPDDPR